MATPEELAEMIHDDVAAAMKEPDHSLRITLLSAIGATAFAIAYEAIPGDPKGVDQASIDFINVLRAAMVHTIPDGTDEQVERITQVWATAAANAAVYYSDPKGTKRWITRLDDRVRDAHRPMHDVTVGAGQSFTVDGWPLRYPGEPVGPPEIWMNCRCSLDHSTVTAGGGMTERTTNAPETPTETPDPWLVHNDELTAASDKPWGQFSASDYSIEQWRRACILTMPGGDPESKSTYKLPIREPGGALNVNGVHAAASRFGQTQAPAEAKAAAKAKLRGAYKQIGEQVPDSLKAAGDDDSLVAWPKSTSPPGTHDAPGWVTNPRETQRLRNYWVKGAGAAKIAWGTPGDLTRCAKYLGKYVGPQYAWGTCQNLHRTALGFWNPESAGRKGDAVEADGGREVLEQGVTTRVERLLAVDWDHHARWVRGVHAAGQRGAGEGAPLRVRGASGNDPGGAAHRPPVQHAAVHEPGAHGTGHASGEHGATVAAGGTSDPLPEGARVHTGEHRPLPVAARAYVSGLPSSIVARGQSPDEGEIEIDMTTPENLAITAAFAAAATLEDDMDSPQPLAPPLEWFQDPGFDAPTPLTITSDGRVLGHLASWDTCHVGITGDCVTPPRSNTNYAHFRTGEVETAEGELVAVGAITMDTGHASPSDGPQVAASHYDDTGTGVADVNAGEDDHGIWVAGAMRPGVSEQQMYVLKATGALSGDWRRIGGNLELVAALAVNVPGFPVPRVEMAASAGRTLSLVAAAVVTTDPNALNAERVAIAVLARLDQREAENKARAERVARADALYDEVRSMRAAAIQAALR